MFVVDVVVEVVVGEVSAVVFKLCVVDSAAVVSFAPCVGVCATVLTKQRANTTAMCTARIMAMCREENERQRVVNEKER